MWNMGNIVPRAASKNVEYGKYSAKSCLKECEIWEIYCQELPQRMWNMGNIVPRAASKNVEYGKSLPVILPRSRVSC
ncbi:hypothetical protein BgiMline_006162 [Biomphalaria glabrata]